MVCGNMLFLILDLIHGKSTHHRHDKEVHMEEQEDKLFGNLRDASNRPWDVLFFQQAEG